MQIIYDVPEHLRHAAAEAAAEAGAASINEWAADVLNDRLENGRPTIPPSDQQTGQQP